MQSRNAKENKSYTTNTLLIYLQQDHENARTPALICHPVLNPFLIVLREYEDNLHHITKARLGYTALKNVTSPCLLYQQENNGYENINIQPDLIVSSSCIADICLGAGVGLSFEITLCALFSTLKRLAFRRTTENTFPISKGLKL